MLALSIFIPISLWIILLPVFMIFFFCGLILPNMVSSTVTLYKQLGGTANAVLGSLIAAGVFLMTSMAALFKAQNQIPMAMLYVTIAGLSLWLFTMVRKLKKQAS